MKIRSVRRMGTFMTRNRKVQVASSIYMDLMTMLVHVDLLKDKRGLLQSPKLTRKEIKKITIAELNKLLRVI